MVPVIEFQADDDLAVLRDRLRRTQERRVILFFPWDARLLARTLDIERVLREAQNAGVEVAVVCPDPGKRGEVRQAGLPVFATVERAQSARRWRHRPPPRVEPPKRHWWEDVVAVWPPPQRIVFPRWLRHIWQGARLIVFLATLAVVATFAIFVIPQSTITLVPQNRTISHIVAVSAVYDPEMEEVDVAQRLIPARRVGDYFEGYIEVGTTGSAAFTAGRATGTVLFTNLLAQDITVPVGTIVRTSSGSFPTRFSTTQPAIVPALGQMSAPIEAVEDGPAGNVGVNQINLVEGIAGLALRVTNPNPTAGGSTESLRAVSQADMDRARELLIAQLLDEAYQELQIYLEPTEMLHQPSLAVQGVELSYNRFLFERADTLGLHMQILVTGLVVDLDNAEAIAYTALSQNIPAGYQLVETTFEIGEAAEEPLGTGDITFFVTATGYTTAALDPLEVKQSIRGQLLEQVAGQLEADFPLAHSPQVTIWPEWFPRMPLLPLRMTVYVLQRG
ncbi:MAG: baseplate J/gp47 family protein [Anaerolineae bacterium]|nr:baseplate J/gp47 family protein [Anaerolineae bacterium]